MPVFKLPLSGDVVQSINPFTAFMTGGQLGLVNINLGQSSDPAVEADVLSDVATYGQAAWPHRRCARRAACAFPSAPAARRAGEGGDQRTQGDARQDRGREGKAQAGRGSPGRGFIGSLAARASRGRFRAAAQLGQSPAAPGTSEPGPSHLTRIRGNIAAFPSEEARWSTCNKEQIGALTDSPKRPRAWRSERA